jgi:hypothetical protein
MLEKELVTVKKGFEGKRHVDKGLIASLKKKKGITIE